MFIKYFYIENKKSEFANRTIVLSILYITSFKNVNFRWKNNKITNMNIFLYYRIMLDTYHDIKL